MLGKGVPTLTPHDLELSWFSYRKKRQLTFLHL